MVECGRSKVASIDENIDIISELPGNLQEHILGFLPLRDAVRTSILSSKWRHCWTRIPHLTFDEEFVASIRYDLRRRHNTRRKAYEFVKVINNILLQHNAPILKLSLAWNESCDDRIISSSVHEWIPLLSRNGIKQLSIHSGSQHFNFNAHHFSCLNLNYLKLQSVKLDSAPAFGGFHCLTELQLNEVHHYEGCIFKCPLLERLTLVYCNGLLHTNFVSPKLKFLYEALSRKLSYAITLAGLESLTEFTFSLVYPHSNQMKTSNVVKVLDSLHKVETLSIKSCSLSYLAAGGSPTRLSKPLNYLKDLNIDLDCAELSAISCLLCIISSAPNLCRLQISATSTRNAKTVEWTVQSCGGEDSDYCIGTLLEIVTFKSIIGYRVEIELIKFLLTRCPSLKIMSIHHIASLKVDTVLKIAEELSQLSRASPGAQVEFHPEHKWRF